MQAYIYNVDSNEILVIIDGENNEEIEATAAFLNYSEDEHGLAYSDNELTETEHTETVKAKPYS